MGLTDTEFEYVRFLVREATGVVIDAEQKHLAESRLGPLASELGFDNDHALVASAGAGDKFRLRLSIVEAMAMRETSFFRDMSVFEILRERVLPSLIESNRSVRRLRIWSAACAGGQEPYSLAMMIHSEFPELLDWDLEILASDVSIPMIQRALSGCFGPVEIGHGLPVQYLMRYFTQRGTEWEIEEAIRRLVRFKLVNLAEAWPEVGEFDLLLLRNVVGCFGLDTRRMILQRVRRHLSGSGCLVLGSAETPLFLDNGFEPCPELPVCGCYRLATSEKRHSDGALVSLHWIGEQEYS